MDQPGNNHLLLRASQSGPPVYNGQHAAADRMRELLARTVHEHITDGQVTANALDEIRRRLDALEEAVSQGKERPNQTLAGIAATLDGLAASLGTIDARVGALENRLERLDERLDDQYDRVSAVNATLAATDTRLAGLGEQFGRSLDEAVAKMAEAGQRDVMARLASLEETVLTLAEALLRPSIRAPYNGGS
jgi:chromosome segregation ATPase